MNNYRVKEVVMPSSEVYYFIEKKSGLFSSWKHVSIYAPSTPTMNTFDTLETAISWVSWLKDQDNPKKIRTERVVWPVSYPLP